MGTGKRLRVGLHEGVVIGMADGYHKVSRQPTFVNVHAAVGTAQTAGQMYNADFDHSALVVTAGLSDNTIASDDMVLAPRPGFTQAEITRQFTKTAWEIRTGVSTALAIRRAYKLAATAPGGPVYVALSTRALAEKVDAEVWPKELFAVDARPRAAADQIDKAARMLIEAERPIVVVGDEVYKADAMVEALALCELIGAPIATPNLAAFQYASFAHPQYLGTRFAADRPYPFGNPDVIVQLGSREAAPGAGALEGAAPRRYIGVGLDTPMLGRTRALDLAIVADVRSASIDLADAVRSLAPSDRLGRIREARLAAVKPAIAAANAERLAFSGVATLASAASKDRGRRPPG